MTTATDTSTQAPFTQPGTAHPAYGSGTPVGAVVPEETKGFSIASLVLGIVSIVAGFTFFVPIAGLVLGILALKREPASRTMAIWGVVLNGVLLAGAALFTIGALVFGLALLPFAFI
ncbi:DUF4190 domain-containing protein [Agromyces sp. G08B096]|uniref:DUF4190 domain-containing protein n=1 Tax=Agromyces sp. G08B096 TaxID=3156399 RepID=A0AAU7W5J8_9MICO